jgi:hypothetical protein
MLKVGTLRWKGRCGRHPQYDPNDGEGAIRGACNRCYALLDIHVQHRRLLELMRAFGPARERPSKVVVAFNDRQRSLFD